MGCAAARRGQSTAFRPIALPLCFYDLGGLAGAEAAGALPSTHLSYQANQRSYRSLMKLGRVNPWNCPG